MSKDEKYIIGYVTPLRNNKFFTFTAFHHLYGKEIETLEREIFDIIKFFDNPPKFFLTSVKGIIFNICGFNRDDEIDYDLCQKLAAKLISLKILFRFVTEWTINAMGKLIAAKIDPVIDGEVLQIYINDDDDDEEDTFSLVWFSRKNNGYIVTKKEKVPETFDPKTLLGSSNPNKIIITELSTKASKLRKSLSAWNTVTVRSCFGAFLFQSLKTIMDHVVDSKNNCLFIVPQSLDDFGIIAVTENPTNDDILIFEEDDQDLPFTKSCIVSRFHKTFYVALKTENGYSVLSTPYHITDKGHRIKLTLSIDLNKLPSIIHGPIILPRIKNMSKKLNVEKTEKLPIIGFFDNASVICLWNEKENCYKFMDSWNGKFGKDLFLNFLLPRPKLVASSSDIISSSGTLYDLIKIMSMPSGDIKVDRNWKFTFTENDDYPVLLEFDTFDGTKKAASPAFLMALTLKQHIKAMRKEIGEKPVKLGFRLFDDFENLEAKKRVETGLKEACEMLKLECLFV